MKERVWVVLMHTFNIEMNQLKKMIETKLSQSYLEKNLKTPSIDMDKLFILNYMYKQSNVPTVDRQQYILTTMLIEIALQIHDSISIDNTSEMSETEIQLSVLAGDFYSAKYYHLLAQVGDIEMIKLLATAIKNISENKMKLIYPTEMQLSDFIMTSQNIEAFIFEAIAESLGTTYLIPAIREALLINKMEKEKRRIKLGGYSSLFEFLKLQIKDCTVEDAVKIIDEVITVHLQKLDDELLNLPYYCSEFKVFLSDKFDLSFNTTVAEEG